MASNPVPLLKSLADTNPAKRDVESLRIFLQLLRQQIGGDAAFDDLTARINQNIADIATNATDIAALQAADAELDKQIYARITLRV